MSKLKVAICVPAYNEEKNISHILQGLISQRTSKVDIKKIVVVCSGCTDKTPKIAKQFCKLDKRIVVKIESERTGKAGAINIFLRIVKEPVVVIQSADTVPYPDCIEKLCRPFLKYKKLGMTGGAPFPINDKETLLGYVIHAWWWFHRNIPRFGEIIAYRNILDSISATTAVDEAFIQAKLVKLGYSIVHVDIARVHNKGPETLADLVKQRRRIYNGHARLFKEQKIKIDHMTRSSLKLLLFKYQIHSLKEFSWFCAGIGIELYARSLGAYDVKIKRSNPFIWDTATSTKNLRENLL